MMTNITIRQYNASDLDRCRALWGELTQHHRDIYDDPSIGGAVAGSYFDKHLARAGPEHIWVAEHNGEVVGFVGLIVGEQEAEVEPIVVASGHRGKGIGKSLLNHAIAEAKRMGVRFLNVRPVARNVEAISFFYNSGFRLLGHIELFMELSSPASGAWKPGPELFGCSFEY